MLTSIISIPAPPWLVISTMLIALATGVICGVWLAQHARAITAWIIRVEKSSARSRLPDSRLTPPTSHRAQK